MVDTVPRRTVFDVIGLELEGAVAVPEAAAGVVTGSASRLVTELACDWLALRLGSQPGTRARRSSPPGRLHSHG